MIGLGIIAVLALVAFVVLPIWSAVKVSGLNREISTLKDQVLRLSKIVADLRQESWKTSPSQPLAAETEPEIELEKAIETSPFEESQPDIPSKIPPLPEPQAVEPPAIPKEGLEENLASKWFVWIGAAAIAMAGLFLVKYIADRGILTPAVRMILAFAMGAALSFGGEWVRRRPIQKAIAALKPSYIPMALTGAGILTMYVSVYASYALYDLIGPLFAFVLLAGVSLLAFGLSILQGAPVAIMGLVGGLVTPALVSTSSPSVFGLFGYLTIIVIACAAVMRYRPWWWLGFAAAGGSFVWAILWSISEAGKGDVMVIAVFLAIMASALVLLVKTKSKPAIASRFEAFSDHGGYTAVGFVAAAAAGLGFLPPLIIDEFSSTGLVFLALITIVFAALAIARPKMEFVVLAGLGVVLAGFAAWGAIHEISGLVKELGANRNQVADVGAGRAEKLAEIYRYVAWAAGFAAAAGIGGFTFQSGRSKPVAWMAFTLLIPLGLLVISYLAFHSAFSDNVWAFAALVLAFAALAAAMLVRKAKPQKHANLYLGLYATGVVAAISLAMVFLLQDAWLTVALCLQLPAIAWISRQLKLPVLRKIAVVIAAVLAIRLTANPYLAHYARDHFLGDHWVLYGYGIPVLATHFALVWFKSERDDYLVTILEGLRIVFFVQLVSAEIRILTTGSLSTGKLTLLESGAQSVAWLAIAWSRLRTYAKQKRAIDFWSGMILLIMGLVMTFVIGLIFKNPAFSAENVGNWPIINKLTLAYVIPAALLWYISQLKVAAQVKRIQTGLGIGVLILLFSYITLETRHMFQGPVLHSYSASSGETYAYSVVWLVFAFALLMFGLIKKRPISRYAALLVLTISVGKVFLFDMAGLSGLWRVASFLGLGLSLVGIGYLYQRFLYLPKHVANKAVAKDR